METWKCPRVFITADAVSLDRLDGLGQLYGQRNR